MKEPMFAYAFCHRFCCHFGQDSLSRVGLIAGDNKSRALGVTDDMFGHAPDERIFNPVRP